MRFGVATLPCLSMIGSSESFRSPMVSAFKFQNFRLSQLGFIGLGQDMAFLAMISVKT